MKSCNWHFYFAKKMLRSLTHRADSLGSSFSQARLSDSERQLLGAQFHLKRVNCPFSLPFEKCGYTQNFTWEPVVANWVWKSVLHPRQCCFTTLKKILLKKTSMTLLKTDQKQRSSLWSVIPSMNPLEVEALSLHAHQCIQASTASRLLAGQVQRPLSPPTPPPRPHIHFASPHLFASLCFAEGGRTLQVPREERILWGYSSH